MTIVREVINLNDDGSCTDFSHADLQRLREACDGTAFAIYVLREGARILYVGETAQGPIRAKGGFKEAYSGTRSYSWRRDEDLRGRQIELLVFSDLATSNVFAEQRARRALEAEVTLEIRLRTGSWPAKMTEIHFSESLSRQQVVVGAKAQIVADLESRQWIPRVGGRTRACS